MVNDKTILEPRVRLDHIHLSLFRLQKSVTAVTNSIRYDNIFDIHAIAVAAKYKEALQMPFPEASTSDVYG